MIPTELNSKSVFDVVEAIGRLKERITKHDEGDLEEYLEVTLIMNDAVDKLIELEER